MSSEPVSGATVEFGVARIVLYQGTALAVPQEHGKDRALAPVVSAPTRNANPEKILSSSRTFFVTTKTGMGQKLLQSERNAMLLIDVLRSYAAAKKFLVHDFVVMPDHVHLLITVENDMTVERAVQFVKGGFSYRLRKEFGYLGEVWQRGFSEARVMDEKSYAQHRQYIAQNPVKAGLVQSPGEFPYCFAQMAAQKAQGLKPPIRPPRSARLKPCPDTKPEPV